MTDLQRLPMLDRRNFRIINAYLYDETEFVIHQCFCRESTVLMLYNGLKPAVYALHAPID